jgi:transcriptional regulator with GAF, ATPase, and Fis domain
MGAAVVVTRGVDEGRELRVGAESMVIGTTAGCDLVLADPTVSRRHLALTCKGKIVELEDLGSKNGSYYAGARFHRLEVTHGAEIMVGHTHLKVLPDEEVLHPVECGDRRFGTLVGGSPAMRQLFTLIEQIAHSEATVLIEGETGVGKELVAQEIHRRSTRAAGPFEVFDCGSVPSELIESALFGHIKGAFTGATTNRVGVFEQAHGGSLFLDEIGELRLDLQPALLRVLDTGKFSPVGTGDYQEVNVRVIAATHRNLAEQIVHRLFREDLYYRIAVVRLTIPPLRDRPEDIPVLVEYFLQKFGFDRSAVDDASMQQLVEHHWSGNVRELRNVVERAVTFVHEGRIELKVGEPLRSAVSPGAGVANIASSSSDRMPSFRQAKAEAIEEFERQYFSELKRRYDTLTAAADAAEMDRKHLRTLFRRYGLV